MGAASTQVRIEGDCGVERIAELKERLEAALQEETECVELDLSGVTRADVSLQQLICAAHRSFSRSDKRIALAAAVPEPVLRMQQEGGFGRVCMFRREDCPFQGGFANE
jgi:ABC-type transporter Mla MlaB component